MIYKNVKTGAAVNIIAGPLRRVLITVNTALTGNIIVSDEAGTAGTPVVATITNPTVGTQYEYWGLQSGVTVTPSTTCDITVNADMSRAGT